MTLEEKAKRYDEVLLRAKEWHSDDQMGIIFKANLENLFIELKESEDEKIRKELTEFLKNASGGFLDSTIQCKTFGKWVAWLKKQDEQKPTTDKVEPKFHVGDWVVQENIGVYKVIEICESWYEVVDSENNHYSISFDNEYMCRRWTIQDAKSGDVLYSLDSKRPFIFKHRKPYEQAEVYCGINIYDKFFVWNTKDCIITTDKYIPATKEQRDILFQKMKEAGFIWNDEKKELKKIEPKFHVGDWVTDGVRRCQIYFIDDTQYWYAKNCILGTIESVDKQYHLWNIYKDAKDGDILCTYEYTEPKIVFILKGTPKKQYALSYHCYYNIMYPHFAPDTEKGCLAPNDEDVKPATKEQRELLFQKIKEAGFEWHEENKKLNIDDEKMLNRLIGVLDGTNKEDYHEGWEYLFLPWLKTLRLQNKR